MVGAVLVPLWLVLAASALYLVPGLGGDWMLDPATGEISFVYYPMFTLAFRGGLVGGMVLAMGTPLLALGFLLATGFSLLGRRREAAQAVAIGHKAGDVAIHVPMVIRKRGRSGRTAHAIPISISDASPLRRMLARLVDTVLLGATVNGAAMFGVLIDTAGVGWKGMTFTTPLMFGAVSGVMLLVVQWLAAWDRGQTLGMVMFDVRVARPDRQDRPGLGAIAIRFPLFDVTDAVVGCGFAWMATQGLLFIAAELSLDAFFVVSVLERALLFLVWPAMMLVTVGIRALPLLFGRERTLHDVMSGTRVVRTAVGETTEDGVPLGFRLLARLVDSLEVVLVVGIALGIGLGVDLVLPGVGSLLAPVLALVAFIAVHAAQAFSLVRWRSTTGKRLLGIEVELLQGDGGFVNLVVVREWLALWGLALALPFLGAAIDAAAALSEDRRAIHDRLAGTRVVWRSASER